VQEVSRNTNSITVTAISGTGGTVSVTPVNACGNGSPLQTSVTVTPVPDVAIVLPSDVFVNEVAAFDYQSSSDLTEFAWSFGDGHTSPDERPENVYEAEGSFQVTLEVTSTLNCKNSDTQSLEVKPDAGLSETDIKNVVTANGDTKNDMLYIVNIEKYPSNEVILVDRWGAEIYRKKGYTNEWDLRKGDQYIPAGNYVCIVKFNGKIVSRTVTVLKN
jgi:gliding motility-associated-like protein